MVGFVAVVDDVTKILLEYVVKGWMMLSPSFGRCYHRLVQHNDDDDEMPVSTVCIIINNY